MALLLGALEALGGDLVPSAYSGSFALAAALALGMALLPIRQPLGDELVSRT